ncbi:MAG: hypothetical protein ABIR18_10415 [Chitinophagaceae bacterium]
MNKLVIFFLLCSFVACERKPYVNHKMEFEKVSDNCSEQQSYFRLNSNFGGERYEFEKCLPVDFKKDQLNSERKGDTVVVRFPKAPATQGAVYHITLDIDSYPRYNFLTIDDDTYAIAPTK